MRDESCVGVKRKDYQADKNMIVASILSREFYTVKFIKYFLLIGFMTCINNNTIDLGYHFQ